jgi:hypothetical protein
MSDFERALNKQAKKTNYPTGTPEPVTILQAINYLDPEIQLKKEDFCQLQCSSKDPTLPNCSCSFIGFFTKQKWFTKESVDAIIYGLIPIDVAVAEHNKTIDWLNATWGEKFCRESEHFRKERDKQKKITEEWFVNRPLRRNYPSPQSYVLAFKEWLKKFEELLKQC